jgi:hypothetical protein
VIVETNGPVIMCPSNVVLYSLTNVEVCYSATANSDCCSNVQVEYDPPSCSYFSPGTVTTVHCTATDCCSNTAVCSFTVTVDTAQTVTNPPCCGPDLGAQTIQWLQLRGSLVSDPSGTNPTNTWILTNLPCYGDVLVTQDAPVEVSVDGANRYYTAPNPDGLFDFTETGYGPYSWTSILNGPTEQIVLGNDISPKQFSDFNVNFYFLDGQPNYCSLVLSVIALAENTTVTVSQPVTFRTEFDLTNIPPKSAYTTLNSNYGPSLMAGVTGTVVGSAYLLDHHGDDYDTGWSVFQPDAELQTTNLPTGSGPGYPGPMSNVPYVTFTVHEEPENLMGLTVGYICCTNCCSNCAPPYPESYTVTVSPGTNYLTDDLCQGTNNTVNEVLPVAPAGTELYLNAPGGGYTVLTYSSGEGKGAGPVGWDEGTTPSAVTLSMGEGFTLINTGNTNFTLTIYVCAPGCFPP